MQTDLPDTPPNPFAAAREARMAVVAADRAAPARVADQFDLNLVHRRCRPDPRATAAALHAPLRRVLTLACEHPAGLPVWALAGIAEWPESLVVAVGERLRERGLARVHLAEDGDAEVVPTATGRQVAAVLHSWRMPHYVR
ncbi:non-ribosomal peptide synthetase [Methylorubrum aminovorans]|uniref:non-ribosomal peptide synthetase n=1 Tax=Methylorubrum aminovorans TaxID=269069 RepID=UPI003C2CBD30